MAEVSAWMPFYIGDYLADTMHLTREHHGAYLLMICHYWRTGPLPIEDEALAAITKSGKKDWERIGPVLLRFFRVEDGQLHHKRIDHELAKAKHNSSKRRDAANTRWMQTPSKADAIALQTDMQTPCKQDDPRVRVPSPSPRREAADAREARDAAAIFEKGEGKQASRVNGRFPGAAGKMPNLNSPWSAWEWLTDGEVEVCGPNAQRRPCTGGYYVDEVARLVAETAMFNGYTEHIDWRPLVSWLKAGYDSTIIVATIKRVASKPDYEPKTNLKYFTPAIVDAAKAAS